MNLAMSRSLFFAALIGANGVHTSCLGASPANAAKIEDSTKSGDVSKFLDLLKAGRPASRKFNIGEVPNWNIQAIVGFISSKGMVLEDVNSKSQNRYSPGEVAQALKERKGEVFESFSHISFLYAKGKKQYSEVKITEKPGLVSATLASWYEMEFVTENGQLKLRRCKYINIEGD